MIRKVTDWLNARQAAEIMTTNSGHRISANYIRRLGSMGKIGFIQVDGRTRLYSREDVANYVVRLQGDGSVRRRLRPREYSHDAA